MTAFIVKEIDCVLCQTSYIPTLGPEDDEAGYPIVCSSGACTNSIYMSLGDPVRSALRAVYRIRGEALALALEEVLSDCPCGSRFSHDAGRRCQDCLEKIEYEKKERAKVNPATHFLWNRQAVKKHEQKLLNFILGKEEAEEETFHALVERYESGEIDPEEYMEELDLLQQRESILLNVVKTWAVGVGEEAFRGAEEFDLVDRYGTRILITIASGIHIGCGQSILTSLSKESTNWDGPIQRDLKNYLTKISGKD